MNSEIRKTDPSLKINLYPQTHRHRRIIASSEAEDRIRIDLVAVKILIEIFDLLEVHRLTLAPDMENIGDELWLPFRMREPGQVIGQSEVQVKNRRRPACCSAPFKNYEPGWTGC